MTPKAPGSIVLGLTDLDDTSLREVVARPSVEIAGS